MPQPVYTFGTEVLLDLDQIASPMTLPEAGEYLADAMDGDIGEWVAYLEMLVDLGLLSWTQDHTNPILLERWEIDRIAIPLTSKRERLLRLLRAIGGSTNFCIHCGAPVPGGLNTTFCSALCAQYHARGVSLADTPELSRDYAALLLGIQPSAIQCAQRRGSLEKPLTLASLYEYAQRPQTMASWDPTRLPRTERERLAPRLRDLLGYL
jgi:hypothetical protein